MLKACVPCVTAIKKLCMLARVIANRMRKVLNDEKLIQEELKRKQFQNDKVKALFEVWQGQEEDEVRFFFAYLSFARFICLTRLVRLMQVMKT